MKHLITAALIAAAVPANAGGPVIITEDMTETAPMPRHDRKIGGLIAVGIGILIIAAITGGKNACNNDEPGPTPEPGC